MTEQQIEEKLIQINIILGVADTTFHKKLFDIYKIGPSLETILELALSYAREGSDQNEIINKITSKYS